MSIGRWVSGVTWLILVLTTSGKFAVTTLFNMMFIYASEVYPTSVRAMGLSASCFFARIGSVLAPFAVELVSLTCYQIKTLNALNLDPYKCIYFRMSSTQVFLSSASLSSASAQPHSPSLFRKHVAPHFRRRSMTSNDFRLSARRTGVVDDASLKMRTRMTSRTRQRWLNCDVNDKCPLLVLQRQFF